MNDERKGYKIVLYAAIVIVGFCVAFLLFGKPSNEVGNSDLQNDTNRTLADSKQQYEFVGSEITVIADRVAQAQQSNERAEKFAYQLNGRIKQHENSIARCTSLIIECRELVEENRAVIQEAGK